jgi:hypothetical protein
MDDRTNELEVQEKDILDSMETVQNFYRRGLFTFQDYIERVNQLTLEGFALRVEYKDEYKLRKLKYAQDILFLSWTKTKFEMRFRSQPDLEFGCVVMKVPLGPVKSRKILLASFTKIASEIAQKFEFVRRIQVVQTEKDFVALYKIIE